MTPDLELMSRIVIAKEFDDYRDYHQSHITDYSNDRAVAIFVHSVVQISSPCGD